MDRHQTYTTAIPRNIIKSRHVAHEYVAADALEANAATLRVSLHSSAMVSA